MTWMFVLSFLSFPLLSDLVREQRISQPRVLETPQPVGSPATRSRRRATPPSARLGAESARTRGTKSLAADTTCAPDRRGFGAVQVTSMNAWLRLSTI